VSPEVCPNCGADVPPKARACPECGADETTGWSDEASAGSLGLPDDSFNYDEFVEREFEGKKPHRKFQRLWVAVAVLVVIALVFLFL
jgi:hypothetical protein